MEAHPLRPNAAIAQSAPVRPGTVWFLLLTSLGITPSPGGNEER